MALGGGTASGSNGAGAAVGSPRLTRAHVRGAVAALEAIKTRAQGGEAASKVAARAL